MTENDVYRDFADAIVVQAVEDWRKAIVNLRRYRTGDKRHNAALRTLEDVSEFFKSKWGEMVCGEVPACDILEKLESELTLL